MRNFFISMATFTICSASAIAATAQVPDRVNDLIQQARGLAKSAQEAAQDAAQDATQQAAGDRTGTIPNPFSRDNAARSRVGIQDSALGSRLGFRPGSRPGVDITDSAININVGGRSITVPRTGPNPVPPSGQGIGQNHLANPSNAFGGVTINGLSEGGCLLRNGVAISESGNVTIDRNGSAISTAAYRELAAGMEAFGRSDFATAVDHLQKSVEANPTDALPFPFLSLALFANSDFDAAAEYAYSAAATSQVWDWNQLRSYYHDPAQYANQYQQLQIAARQVSASPSTHFLLAWHHLMLGHRDAAQAELDRVLRHLPNDPVALGLKARAQQPIVAPPEPMK